MNIHETAIVSTKSYLDKTNPKGIYIGAYSGVARGASILTHDHVLGDRVHRDTKIGDNVFIGINAVILPGVTINNNVIISAGSIVKGNIPSNCIVEGNPAKIIYRDVKIGKYGQLTEYTKRQDGKNKKNNS
ncbi:MAG: acyltransferase [Salinivirgaceae bacterium]|nr:acyltransferase [Salinivirgaceae bacterium]